MISSNCSNKQKSYNLFTKKYDDVQGTVSSQPNSHYCKIHFIYFETGLFNKIVPSNID